MVKELLLQKQCVQNITNNNYIIINSFGEENTDYLRQDESFVKKCIESPMQSIQKYLDAVHFNKEHPENNNIKLTNLHPFYFFKSTRFKSTLTKVNVIFMVIEVNSHKFKIVSKFLCINANLFTNFFIQLKI